MKILCRFTEDEEGFVPAPFDLPTVKKITQDIQDALVERFYRRYRDLDVQFYHPQYTDDKMKVTVSLWNKDQKKKEAIFEFEPYSEYWDKSDYDQHVKRTIVDFVRSIG